MQLQLYIQHEGNCKEYLIGQPRCQSRGCHVCAPSQMLFAPAATKLRKSLASLGTARTWVLKFCSYQLHNNLAIGKKSLTLPRESSGNSVCYNKSKTKDYASDWKIKILITKKINLTPAEPAHTGFFCWFCVRSFGFLLFGPEGCWRAGIATGHTFCCIQLQDHMCGAEYASTMVYGIGSKLATPQLVYCPWRRPP